MRFEVLSEGLFDVRSIHDLCIDQIADVFENEVDLTNWRALDKVLNDLSLDAAHFYFNNSKILILGFWGFGEIGRSHV